jgi:hypothetical protein
MGVRRRSYEDPADRGNRGGMHTVSEQGQHGIGGGRDLTGGAAREGVNGNMG